MPNLPITRQSLLLRLKSQNNDAWREFLAIYEGALLDFAKRKGLQEADALDVTQEVLAALEKKLPEWEANPERGKLRGWLFRVARNLAVNKIMERAKAPLALEGMNSSGLDELMQVSEAQTQEFVNRYRRQLFHWAGEKVRSRVKEATWQAFWLTAMEGKSAEEVGSQLGMTTGNVYAAKFRVTARIQAQVDMVNGLEEDLQVEPGGRDE